MTTKPFKKEDYNTWNSFVDASPQGSLFAKTWYLEALGISFEILVCLKKDQIKGGIILPKDKWNYYINPVLCKYLGIFFFSFEGNPYTIESRQREVQNFLLKELKALSSFEYTFHPSYKNWMPFERNNFKQTSRYTYLLPLTKENLLEQANARLRTKITKAQQSEITFQAIENLEEALLIIESTYERQGISLPLKKDRLQNLINVLKAQEAFYLIGAFNKGEKLNAVLGLFYDNDTAYLILNGINNENVENGVNEALIYEGIKWAKQKGLTTFDFEGSMIPSIESFYRQFGGELTPYFKIWKESKQRSLRNLKQKISG